MMLRRLMFFAVVALCGPGFVECSQGADKVPAALDFEMQTLAGQPVEAVEVLKARSCCS
jgi:hypothetical protein